MLKNIQRPVKKAMSHGIEHPRREFLLQALSMGLLAAPVFRVSPTHALGDIAKKLPPGRSIYKLKGLVRVDGQRADINTQISANSLVETGDSSRIIFVVGTDAFILRKNSELQLNGEGLLIQGMRMLSGKLLSVFGERAKPHQIKTRSATIGIRGTGIYLESDAERSYVCSCYGHTFISANSDPDANVEVMASYHDAPYYIYANSAPNSKLIRPAPVINHTDSELELIEQLVGRTTPFETTYFSSGEGGGGY